MTIFLWAKEVNGGVSVDIVTTMSFWGRKLNGGGCGTSARGAAECAAFYSLGSQRTIPPTSKPILIGAPPLRFIKWDEQTVNKLAAAF